MSTAASASAGAREWDMGFFIRILGGRGAACRVNAPAARRLTVATANDARR